MGDEPPYLSVGTEVSAKYKGAFCEAKIRKVVRSVKCKVLFKQGLGSATVQDDFIKGSLKHGAIVEARHPDKKDFVEATISKVQDCSQYTVVFDDGDITTLRRTAICLKSGRHFAESETLDQLPLTHPEHFSNPVIGGKRGRRRTGFDENSDEDESYTHLKDFCDEKEEDIGRVICVEGEKKKHNKDNWFPALVVAPTAQDTVPIDVRLEYLVRSFKDGRYYTVPKKEAMEFTREMGSKVDNTTAKTAVEKALLFLDKDELPPHWDRDSLFGLNESMVTDSDAGNDGETSDDETREEKDHFVAQLYKFMDDSGTPINKAPLILAQDLDLYRLFKVVQNLGGFNRVSNHNNWKTVSHKMGFGQNPSTVALVKQSYKKFLFSFEDFYRKLGCTMVSHPRTSRNRSTRSLIRDKDKVVKNEMKLPSKEKIEASPEYPLIPSPVPPIKLETTDEDLQIETTPTPKLSREKSGVRKLPEPPVIESPPAPEEPPVVEEVNTEVKDGKKTRMKKSKIEKMEQTMKKIEEREGTLKETKRRLFTRSKRDKEKSAIKTLITPTITRQKRTFKEKIKGIVDQLKLKTSKYAASALGLQDISEKVVQPKKVKEESVVQKIKKEEVLPPIPPGSEEKRKGRKRKEKSEIIDDRFDTLPTYKTVSVGDKLKVYYGPKHDLKVTYEAKVLSIRQENNETLYLVHYYGWNTRYDEWIKHSRVADNMSWVPGRPSRKSLQVHKNTRRKNAALKLENEDSIKMESESMYCESSTSGLHGPTKHDSPEPPHFLSMKPKGTRTSTRAFNNKRILTNYENDAESESENIEFSSFSRAKSCDFTEVKISPNEKRARKRKSSEGDSLEIQSSCKSEEVISGFNKKIRKRLEPTYLSGTLMSSVEKCEDDKKVFSRIEENIGNKDLVSSEVQFKNKSSTTKVLSKEDIPSTLFDKNTVGVTAEKKFKKDSVILDSEVKKKLQPITQTVKKEDTISQCAEEKKLEKSAKEIGNVTISEKRTALQGSSGQKTVQEISNVSASGVEWEIIKDVSKVSEIKDKKLVHTPEQKVKNENVTITEGKPKLQLVELPQKKNILISPSCDSKLQFSVESRIKQDVQSANTKNKAEQKLMKECVNFLPFERKAEQKAKKGTNISTIDIKNTLNPVVVEKSREEIMNIVGCAIMTKPKTSEDQREKIEMSNDLTSPIEKEILPLIEQKSKQEIFSSSTIDSVIDLMSGKKSAIIPISENMDKVTPGDGNEKKEESIVSSASDYKSVTTIVQKDLGNAVSSIPESFTSNSEYKLESGVSCDKKIKVLSAAELRDKIEMSSTAQVESMQQMYSMTEEKPKNDISEVLVCEKKKLLPYEPKLKKRMLSADYVKKSKELSSPSYKKDILNLSASVSKDKYLSVVDRKFKVEGVEISDIDSKKLSQTAKQKVQVMPTRDSDNKNKLPQSGKQKIEDTFDCDNKSKLSKVQQKFEDAFGNDSKRKLPQTAKQKDQESSDTDINKLLPAKQKIQDTLDSSSKLPQTTKQKVQDNFEIDIINKLSQTNQKVQDTVDSSNKGKLSQAVELKVQQDTFDCDSKNKSSEVAEQKVRDTFVIDNKNKSPETAKQEIQDTIARNSHTKAKLPQAAKQKAQDTFDSNTMDKLPQVGKQEVQDTLDSDSKNAFSECSKQKDIITPVSECENKKSASELKEECSNTNNSPRCKNEAKMKSNVSVSGIRNKPMNITSSMVRKIVGSEDSSSDDEGNLTIIGLTKKQLLGLNKKIVKNVKENPVKGCDFDLNQIRSELKGIDTAVCSGSPSDDSEDEGEDEDEENDEAGSDERSEYPDIENVSIETVKEDVDDIYEFKEPEPFEFETRKIVDDKNILQRRSLRGFSFDDAKATIINVDSPSVSSFKSKVPVDDTAKTDISESEYVGIHTCEEAFDKICASPLRAATEASSVFDDQDVNDTPDDDSQDRLVISERYSDTESNMSVSTQKEVQEKEVKANLPAITEEKISERVDYFGKGNKLHSDIEKVEMEIKENFIKEEWKDDVEDEALNVAIQRAINQELSEEKDEMLSGNKNDIQSTSVNKFDINESKIVICGELSAGSFKVHKDTGFSYQFSFLKQTSEILNESISSGETIEENIETNVEVSSEIVPVLAPDLKNSKEILLEDKAVAEEIVNEDVEEEIEVVVAVDIEIKGSDQESKIVLTDGSVSEKIVFSLEPEEEDEEEDAEVDVGNGVEGEVIVEDIEEEEEEEENLISLICNEEIIPSSPTPQVDLQEEEKNLATSRGSDEPGLGDDVKKDTGQDSCLGLDDNETHEPNCSQIDSRLHSISSDTSTVSAPQTEDTSRDLPPLQTVKAESSSKQKPHIETEKKHRTDTRSSKKPAVKKGKRPRKRSQDVGKRKYSRNRHGSDSDEFYESRTPSGRSESHRHCRNSKFQLLKLDPELDSNGRIAAIQNSMQQLRTAYAEAKAELAVIDRRRKKLRRREREKNAHR